MAFWKKKSEDPWDMDPNRKREPVLFYEREPELNSEPILKEQEGLAMPAAVAEREQPEEPEEAPECPWCGKEMVRAYLIGGREPVYLSDQKPTLFLGSLGCDVQDLSDVGFFTTHTSCWQCKPCRKVVVEVPDPVPEDSFERWDGNPVAPYKPEKQEKEE